MTLVLRATAFATLTAIMVLLLGPATPIELDPSYPTGDKIAHFLAFGILLWTFGILVPKQTRIALAMSAVLVGGLVEVIQGLTGRDAEWLDLAADAAGVATALGVWAIWRKFQPRRARQQGLS